MAVVLTLLHSFLFAFVTLLPLVNPVAYAPFFQRITEHCTQEERKWLAQKTALYCAILMVIVLFVGTPFLRLFGLQLPFVQIAGGILVAYAGWEALRSTPQKSREEERPTTRDFHGLAFFPLTLPLTVGPGAIAATLGLAGQAGELLKRTTPALKIVQLSQYGGIVLAMLVAAVAIRFCYAYAGAIFQRLGKTGTAVVSNLSALIILATGLQILWSGLRVLLLGLAATQ